MAHPIQTLAFPAISCGVYGYPIAQASRIALQTTVDVLQGKTGITTVIFACFGDPTYQAYLQAAQALALDVEQG